MNDDVIKERILDFHVLGMPEYLKRDQDVPFLRDMATSIAGARKAGKTYRAFQAIRELIYSGRIAGIDQVCYLHFDDEALLGLDVHSLSAVDRVFLSLESTSSQADGTHLYVFDEIHKIEGWEAFVLRLIRKQNQLVLITGSSVDLEEDKVGRQLRGKTFTRRLFPLSFSEFLKFRETQIVPRRYAASDIPLLSRLFGEYVEIGSYPGVVTAPRVLQHELLLNYFSSVVSADFVFDKPVSNPIACKTYLRNLLQRNGSPYRHKKERNSLASMGHPVAPHTISQWFHWAESAYLVEGCPIHSPSRKRIEQNYRKVYTVDWALAAAVSGAVDDRRSRALESIVYWHLRREGYLVSYDLVGPEKYEIDFLVRYPGKEPHVAIQVCYSLASSDVVEREVRGFKFLCKRYPGIECCIITADERPPSLPGIRTKTAWRYCLESLE